MSTIEREKVKRKYRAIPDEKKRQKIGQTLFGLLLVAIGGAIALKTEGVTVQLGGILVIGLGGFYVSQDMTRQGVAFLAATAKDLLTRAPATSKPADDTDES